MFQHALPHVPVFNRFYLHTEVKHSSEYTHQVTVIGWFDSLTNDQKNRSLLHGLWPLVVSFFVEQGWSTHETHVDMLCSVQVYALCVF